MKSESKPEESVDVPKVSLSRAKALAGKVGLLLFSLIATLFIVEMIARSRDMSFSVATDINYDRPERNYYPSTERMNPYVRKDEPVGLKVGLVGDSFTNGVGVPYQDKYGVRLEYLLNLNSNVPPAVVHIKAVDGTSTYRHYRMLQPLFDEHGKPDLLILGVCLNDAEDEATRNDWIHWRHAGIPRPPEGLAKAICERSHLASFLYNKKEVKRAMTAHEDYYQKIYAEDYSGYQKFQKYIRLIKEAMDERDVKFLVVVWPLLGDLNPETYKFDNIHEKIHGVLEANGVAYVDLKPYFMGKNAERLQVVPFVDGHPNEIAHRMASEIIFRTLLNQKLIPPVYWPQHATGPIYRLYQQRYDKLNPAKPAKE